MDFNKKEGILMAEGIGAIAGLLLIAFAGSKGRS